MMEESPPAPLLALRTASLQAQLKATRSLPFEEEEATAADPAADWALRVFEAGGSVVSHSFWRAARGWALGFFEEMWLEGLLLL